MDTFGLWGDNPEDSHDSRHYGAVPLGNLRKKMLCAFSPDPYHLFCVGREKDPNYECTCQAGWEEKKTLGQLFSGLLRELFKK